MVELDIPEDRDYSAAYNFSLPESPCVIKSLFADSVEPQKPSIWIISNDGQKICIPFQIRKLVAKLIKETTPRG